MIISYICRDADKLKRCMQKTVAKQKILVLVESLVTWFTLWTSGIVINSVYHIAGKFDRAKVWRMNRFSQKVIIVSRNLDGFSLVNKGWFAKFAKLSRYTVGYLFTHHPIHCAIYDMSNNYPYLCESLIVTVNFIKKKLILYRKMRD